jgi:hypothetical protein
MMSLLSGHGSGKFRISSSRIPVPKPLVRLTVLTVLTVISYRVRECEDGFE